MSKRLLKSAEILIFFPLTNSTIATGEVNMILFITKVNKKKHFKLQNHILRYAQKTTIQLKRGGSLYKETFLRKIFIS